MAPTSPNAASRAVAAHRVPSGQQADARGEDEDRAADPGQQRVLVALAERLDGERLERLRGEVDHGAADGDDRRGRRSEEGREQWPTAVATAAASTPATIDRIMAGIRATDRRGWSRAHNAGHERRARQRSARRDAYVPGHADAVAHHATDDHGEDHGHDDHAHGADEAALGPVDAFAWGAGCSASWPGCSW